MSQRETIWFGGNDGRIFCHLAGSSDAIAMSMDKSYVPLDGPPYEGAVGYQGYDPIIVDVGPVNTVEEGEELYRKLFPPQDAG